MNLEEAFVVETGLPRIRACKRKTRTRITKCGQSQREKNQDERERKKKKNNKSETIAHSARCTVRWYNCAWYTFEGIFR